MNSVLLNPWVWRMAWRDTRASRRRLLLFSLSIVLGIAALVAISSLGVNLQSTIDDQAKSLLGADLVIHSRDEFTPEAETLIQSVGGEQSREVSFSSMVYFPKSEGTRLVQVRGLTGKFPFYGEIDTTPPGAARQFQQSQGALVEKSLMTQFGVSVGDPVRVGSLFLPIVGVLERVPGETVAFSTIAPRVYIPLEAAAESGLLRTESLARYKVFLKVPDSFNVNQWVSENREILRESRLGTDTVDERKEDLGRSMENLEHFLNLGGFIALLLGGVGIASAIDVHVRQKLGSVATLRCLGATVSQTFSIYLLQGIGLGFLGASVGALLGVGIQYYLPGIISDFVPFDVRVEIVWGAVLRAMGVGFGICFLFALVPLLPTRKVSPLAALRSSFEPVPVGNDPLRWLVFGAIGSALLAFAISQTRRWEHGAGFATGIFAAFLTLALVARLIIWSARRFAPSRAAYVWRQGLSNLYRPRNRTLLLLLSLGLGTFLVMTLYLTQRVLLTELIPGGANDKPNAALFDIQTDQLPGVRAILKTNGLQILQEAPIVTMRLSAIKEKSVARILKERNHGFPHWALRREYRSTYRDTLVDSEESIGGKWPAAKVDDWIPVSVEEGIAKELKLGLGDTLAFDVQGVEMKLRVAHLRKVDWRRIQPNFFVVFPGGVLEEAPSFHIFTTRVASAEESAKMQREVVRAFPNVSIIDLTLVLETVDRILSKLSFVIQFMALFTIITGLIVLIAAISTGRYQRIQESILLRVLGASKKQVMQILLVEYFLLGLLASITGLVLSVGASWALAVFLFKMKFAFPLLPVLASIVIVSSITIITGLLSSRGLLARPPLEILRAEA
ncbi:MAG: FtsX-like permease family protein [Verrucomicrobiota bacterium]|nr:FtsX-like permease family protein [Verrucomicrobiota bacterium]